VTPRIDVRDAGSLLEATREALGACSDGLDTSAVQPDTPLAAVVFDSLMALNFIASLEVRLGVTDLPFEQWLAEHSERTDALTVGSLIEWLRSLSRRGGDLAPVPRAAPRDGERG
jgi:acyl carrier protein